MLAAVLNDDWRKGHHNKRNVNRHPERRQECCGRKKGNGIVTQSEESIPLHDGFGIMKENN